MKICSFGIAAVIPLYILSYLKISHATDPNENADGLLLEGSLTNDVPELFNPDDLREYANEESHEDGKTHGVRQLLLGAKKKTKRVEAGLNDLFKTTADVQGELMKQGAMQMRLAEELERQKLSQIPQETIHYHYVFDDFNNSKDKYNDPPYSRIAVPSYGSEDSYVLPQVYESFSSKRAAYVPVKNAGSYYKNLWNKFGK